MAGAQGQGPVGRTPTCSPGSLGVPGGPPVGPAGSGQGLHAGPLQGLPLGTQGGGGVWAASRPWVVEVVSARPFAAWGPAQGLLPLSHGHVLLTHPFVLLL